MNTLPADVITSNIILSYLDMTTFSRLMQTSRSLHRLSTASLWRQMLRRDYPSTQANNSYLSYKRIHLQRCRLRRIDPMRLTTSHSYQGTNCYRLDEIKQLSRQVGIKIGRKKKGELVAEIRSLLKSL